MITLLILMGLEIGFGAWTMGWQKEKEKWLKNRLLISGIQWGLILMMLVLPVGNKALRFTGAAILLGLRFFIGGIRYLIKRRKASGERGKLRTILGTVSGCAIIFLALLPALIFTGYQGLKTTGQYEVKTVSAILTDESRLETFEKDGSHREVPIYVYYPEIRGESTDVKFPLILFSHGAFGYYQSNASTYMELASNGYVVISMEHPYHSIFTKDTEGKTIMADRGFLQDALRIGNAEDGTIPEEEIFETSRGWMKLRTEDMGFVLDEVTAKATDVQSSENGQGSMSGKVGKGISHGSSLPGEVWHVERREEMEKALAMIDLTKIGVMGHSMGGATSVTIGRTRNDVDAVIDVDGTMLGEQLSFENGVYRYYDEAYPVPLLAFNNEKHQKDYANYGTNYVNGAVLANAKDGRYTYVKGSGHVNYTDLPLFSPFLSSLLGTGSVDAKGCVETMNGVVLQFFDHYLKGVGELQIMDAYEITAK